MQNKKRGVETLKNSAASFIDAEFVEKATLWILRILFKLDGFNEFIDRDGYLHNQDIFIFLGGEKYFGDGRETLEKRKQIITDFSHELAMLEKKSPKSTKNTTLAKNIQKITTLIQLNKVEQQIVEFVFLVKQHKILEDAMEFLGRNLTTKQVKRVLSIVLDIDYVKVDEAFKSNAKLVRSSLLTINKEATIFVERKFDSISDTFIDNMTNSDEKISTMLQDILRPCKESDLKLGDYRHLKKDINIILSYLKKSLKKKQKGVNILLYGAAGTGKTELTKVLAKELKLDLYEVSYADEEDNAMDGQARIKAYKVAQALLAHQNTLLMYDEAEDIFESNKGGLFAPASRQKDKAWINRMLENNSVATVWITNNIHSIDPAITRRFDYTLEVPVPKKSQRKKIIQKYSQGMLDDKTVKLLATHPTIAPAVIAQATKVIRNMEYQEGSKEFLRIVNNTIKAQGFELIKTAKKRTSGNKLPSVYKSEYVNSDTDLDRLTQGIKKNPNARICLYGPAGTGKSAFGKYIAKELKKQLLLKKGSDLISQWVGGTEKNIADAFAEAKKKKAVLVFDEVDSFLQDRTTARTSWEVTQVNEMLVQMENFDGVFIATTNLMDNLDRASLRRFDLKLEFGYLKTEQAWELFKAYMQELKIKGSVEKYKKEMKSVDYLTPGDFAAVIRQHRFRTVDTVAEFLQRLQEEVAVKNIEQESKAMGFVR